MSVRSVLTVRMRSQIPDAGASSASSGGAPIAIVAAAAGGGGALLIVLIVVLLVRRRRSKDINAAAPLRSAAALPATSARPMSEARPFSEIINMDMFHEYHAAYHAALDDAEQRQAAPVSQAEAPAKFRVQSGAISEDVFDILMESRQAIDPRAPPMRDSWHRDSVIQAGANAPAQGQPRLISNSGTPIGDEMFDVLMTSMQAIDPLSPGTVRDSWKTDSALMNRGSFPSPSLVARESKF
jgi:hypothetical protein